MFYNLTKRIIDIVISLIVLIIFSPVFLIAPLLIKLGSSGPVFADIPRRVGKNGILFRMYKFRSMVCNAHDLLLNDPKFRKLYEEYKKGSYKLTSERPETCQLPVMPGFAPKSSFTYFFVPG